MFRIVAPLAGAFAIAVALSGCGGGTRPATPQPDHDADRAFEAAAEAFYWAHLDFRPSFAVELGHHRYDGQVPDRSPGAIAAEVARLRAARDAFAAFEAAPLTPRHQLERAQLLAEIRKELFDLEVRRRPFREPFYYLRGFSLHVYAARDYAPREDRARAIVAGCDGAVAYYEQAAANLEEALPAPWLQAGVMMTRGAVAFVRGDLRAAFDGLGDHALGQELDACTERIAVALDDFKRRLEARMPAATGDFALGADGMLAMLRETEAIELELGTLERLARDDLARNQAALRDAARQIDPDASVADVVAMVAADKPAADQVIAEATAMVARLRRFVEVNAIASLPRPDEVAQVADSPPFFRGNFAGLGGSGPFEPRPFPGTFYITPPDPSWPAAEQQAYLPSRADLLFIAAHEVWPGHFLQGMHQRASGSRILQTFEVNTTSEGWAHYAEEMMWDAGLGDGDPRIRIGMLKNALLRDVRFVVALGLHTGDMTIDEAVALFRDQAYADPGNARQQALRGTVDPMYLGYTLGKLAIRKLADDWRARNPGAALGAFHDAFLAHGEAPLPVIRTMMLGADGGPLL
jgi:uncharacterized protein (DUF885 family)